MKMCSLSSGSKTCDGGRSKPSTQRTQADSNGGGAGVTWYMQQQQRRRQQQQQKQQQQHLTSQTCSQLLDLLRFPVNHIQQLDDACISFSRGGGTISTGTPIPRIEDKASRPLVERGAMHADGCVERGGRAGLGAADNGVAAP
jgi:hypothetical protein